MQINQVIGWSGGWPLRAYASSWGNSQTSFNENGLVNIKSPWRILVYSQGLDGFPSLTDVCRYIASRLIWCQVIACYAEATAVHEEPKGNNCLFPGEIPIVEHVNHLGYLKDRLGLSQARVRLIASATDKANFSRSSCIIPISMNNLNQQGYKFFSILEKAIQSFRSVDVMLTDGLHAHNIMCESELSDLKEARKLGKIAGDKWIQAHSMQLPSEILTRIIRWDHIVNHSLYDESVNLINSIYEENQTFENYVHATADLFCLRAIEKMAFMGRPYSSAYKHAINYILEECAGLIVLSTYGFNYEIYPVKRIMPMDWVHSNVISKQYKNTLREVTLKINTRSPHKQEKLAII